MEAIIRLYFSKVQNRNYLGVWTKGATYNPLDFQVHSFYGHHSTSASAQGYIYRQLHVYTNTKELHLPLYIVQSFNGVTVDWETQKIQQILLEIPMELFKIVF